MRSTGWSRSSWITIAPVLLGAFLRLHQLDAQSFWSAEGPIALVAGPRLREVLSNAFDATNPPGYYLPIHFWGRIAAGGDLTLRLPSSFMDLLGTCLAYQLGSAICASHTDLWTASMTTLAPFHVFYFQESRMYRQLRNLTCILILACVHLWRGQNGSLWTHDFAGFLLVTLGAYFVLIKPSRGKSRTSWPPRVDAIVPEQRWLDYFALSVTILTAFSLGLSYAPHPVVLTKACGEFEDGKVDILDLRSKTSEEPPQLNLFEHTPSAFAASKVAIHRI